MRDIDISGINFQDIRILIYAIRFGSVTQTAKHLYLTQSLVSKRIAQFEKRTGLILFLHQNGKLQSTSVARAILPQLEHIYSLMITSMENVHAIQTGMRGVLSIGLMDWHNSRFSDFIRTFLQKNEQIEPFVNIYSSFGDLQDALIRGEFDLIITSSFDTGNKFQEGFKQFVLAEEPLAVFMNAANPLAGRHSLTMGDLRRESFIMPDMDQAPAYYQTMLNRCNDAGFTPRIVHHSDNLMTHLINLRLNLGILIASRLVLSDDLGTDIAAVPLEGMATHLNIVYNEKSSNPCLWRFMEYAANVKEQNLFRDSALK